MASRSPLIEYIITHQDSLIQIDFAKELWMIPERLVAELDSAKLGDKDAFYISTPQPLYKGKLFVYGQKFYGVDAFERVDDRHQEYPAYHVTAVDTGIIYDPKENIALCTPQDTFTLNPGEIVNFTGDTPIETTLGIFVANYLFLCYPFGDILPYYNDTISTAKLEKMISIPFIEGRIKTSDVKQKYINTLSLFGQSTEIIVPGISEKTITIPQSIHDLRHKLVSDNKAALEAGDASVMSMIEKQLIDAYKEYLKGDPSLHFLLKKKYFDVTLKKLFLVQGMTEVFGSPGKFTFIDNPMGKGWNLKDLPAIFNEVRSGSYSRAVETADGGVIAKLILRVFQDTRIAVDDCGTTRGEHIHATPDNLKDFIWNYVIESPEITSLITEENATSYVGRNLVVRTPGYCQATQGFCAKCFGRLFEVLGQKAFAPVANDFARTITTNSLKSMHGKSHSVKDVSELNRYLISR
jgi:hypothetical protein